MGICGLYDPRSTNMTLLRADIRGFEGFFCCCCCLFFVCFAPTTHSSMPSCRGLQVRWNFFTSSAVVEAAAWWDPPPSDSLLMPHFFGTCLTRGERWACGRYHCSHGAGGATVGVRDVSCNITKGGRCRDKKKKNPCQKMLDSVAIRV